MAALPGGADGIEEDADRREERLRMPIPPLLAEAGMSTMREDSSSANDQLGGDMRYSNGEKTPDSSNARRHTFARVTLETHTSGHWGRNGHHVLGKFGPLHHANQSLQRHRFRETPAASFRLSSIAFVDQATLATGTNLETFVPREQVLSFYSHCMRAAMTLAPNVIASKKATTVVR